MSSSPLSVVILISGRGSNMRAIVEARNAGLDLDIKCIISSKADAPGLVFAREQGITTQVIGGDEHQNRQSYDNALMQCIDQYQPDLVVLAGFMRILSDELVNHYLGHMINIHPSLLPAFKGLNTHQQALDADVKKHGASVHFVTPLLDGGPVICQTRVPVQNNDTAKSLAERVLQQEHRIYPLTIKWFQEGRIEFKSHQIWFDGQPLKEPIIV